MALKLHPSLFAPSLLLVAAACSPSPAAPALTETPAPASTPAYFADAAALQAFDPEDTMYQHRVTLGDPTDPRAVLHIAFKAASEDRQISPTGMAGGELLDRGSMLLLGEEPPRQALVAEGKDMAAVYVCGTVHRGELVFWCGLQYAGSPLTDPGLSPQTERFADAVIASIQVLP